MLCTHARVQRVAKTTEGSSADLWRHVTLTYMDW